MDTKKAHLQKALGANAEIYVDRRSPRSIVGH